MIKKLILFTLLSLSFCSFLSSSTYESIKDSSTFELLAPEVNPFWRFTEEELGNKFNYGEDLPPVDTNTISPFSNKTFPKRYNVLEEYPQCVPVVKNQEQCHSSTVFASTTSLAYRFCMKTGKYVELSVQDQISLVTVLLEILILLINTLSLLELYQKNVSHLSLKMQHFILNVLMNAQISKLNIRDIMLGNG